MDRSLVLVGVLFSNPALACVPMHAGLANAPALGSAGTEPRVTDVIANGLDSCGRALDPGPLRNRVPPCPHVAPSRRQLTLAPARGSDDKFVFPWVEHYYFGFPCRERPMDEEVAGALDLVAFTPSLVVAPGCSPTNW